LKTPPDFPYRSDLYVLPRRGWKSLATSGFSAFSYYVNKERQKNLAVCYTLGMSGEEPHEPPSSMIDRVHKLQRKLNESEELIKTPLATYHNPYLRDPRYLNSPLLDEISRLKLPELTRTEVEGVTEDLRLKGPLTIRRLIPTEDEAKFIIIPSLGIGGRAISDHEARLYFDPLNTHVVESLSYWAGREIAHELNHLTRWQAKIRGKTLLDAFIFEGLATVYEEHYGNRYQPTLWGQALSKEQIVSEWQKAQQENPLFRQVISEICKGC